MPIVRDVAAELAAEDLIDILSKGVPLPPPFEMKGPIRLRLKIKHHIALLVKYNIEGMTLD